MTTRPKQANNKNLKFKNYLLARMQCKGQGYMMLENPTQIPIEDHLALTKVPMCHYGFLQILPLLILIVGDIPPGTTRWYMGRTIRGGLAREIKV